MVCIAVVSQLTLAETKQPNIVIIFNDDQGYQDLGCYGSPDIKTPRVDQMAAEGMKFTDAYAACTVCSPTRASIMTGKYPARLHLTDFIAGQNRPWAKLTVPNWQKGLLHTHTTLAEALKAQGSLAGFQKIFLLRVPMNS